MPLHTQEQNIINPGKPSGLGGVSDRVAKKSYIFVTTKTRYCTVYCTLLNVQITLYTFQCSVVQCPYNGPTVNHTMADLQTGLCCVSHKLLVNMLIGTGVWVVAGGSIFKL